MFSQTTEDFSGRLQYLLSDASREEQEIEEFFRKSLNSLTETLKLFEQILGRMKKQLEEEVVTPDELWENRDFRLLEGYPIICQPNFGVPDLEQKLEPLEKADRLLGLLSQIEETRQAIIRCNHETDEFILTAWRKKHPYFSSMGILDRAIDISSGREVQSDTLKDLKTLDRR